MKFFSSLSSKSSIKRRSPPGPGIRRERMWQFALLALLAAYLVVFSIINFCGFTDFMTPDIYSDTLAARYMWEQKSLFPEGWVFGNQYYVVATPVLSALFYGLIGSMNLAMAIATTVMTLALLAACYWLFRSFLGQTQALAGLVALVASVLSIKLSSKYEAQILFLMASYYSCYLLTAVIVWGDYVQALFQKKRLACPSFFLGIFLSFATGMQSPRQTCVMVLPLLGFEGLRVLITCLDRRPVDWKPALRTVCVAAANVCGLLLMSLLQIPSVHIYGVHSHSLSQRLSSLVRALCGITNLSYIHKFGPNKTWFIFLFSLASIAVVLAALWRTAMRLRNHRVNILDAMIGLCVLSLLAVCATIVLPKFSVRSIYLFMWYFLVCLSVVSLIDTNTKRGKQLTLALLCIVAALNLRHSYANDLRHALTKGQDTYFSYYVDIAGELEKSDFEILYASVSEGSVIASYTDGKVICSPWHHEDLFQSVGYIYPQDLRGPEDNDRAVYLIPDKHLEEARRQAQEKSAELTLVRQFETMALYTSSVQLMRPVI